MSGEGGAPAPPAAGAAAAGRLYPTRPLLGVGVVVLRGPGRAGGGEEVLLIRRARPPRQGQWSIPGGLVEAGEALEAAARREVSEETGVALAAGPLRFLATVEAVGRDALGRIESHYVLIDYAARAATDRLAPDPAEVEAAAWVPAGELAALGMWHETERVIGLALLAGPPPEPAGGDGR